MPKKFKFEAIASTVGERFNFAPGDEIELDQDEAKELIGAQAVRPMDPRMPDSFLPKPRAAKKTDAPAKGKPGNQTSDGKPSGGNDSGGGQGGSDNQNAS